MRMKVLTFSVLSVYFLANLYNTPYPSNARSPQGKRCGGCSSPIGQVGWVDGARNQAQRIKGVQLIRDPL